MSGREISFDLLERTLRDYSWNPVRDRIPIVWSDAHKARLAQTAAGQGTIRSHIDQRIAQDLLMCVDGRFAEAEADIVNCLRATYLDPRFYANSETSITLLNGLFTVQHFDLLAAVLSDLYGFPAELKIGTYSAGFGRSCIRWTVSDTNSHLFEFDRESFNTDLTRETILGLQWSFPLYAKYAEGPDCPPGSVIINQNDIGHVPGLAWCDNRPDYFLVPDCIFIPTKGYAYAREVFEKKAVNWSDKAPVGFWRGGTTGIPKAIGDWRSLERVKLCELANRPENLPIMDCGLSSIVQFSDPQIIDEIQNSGFVKDRVPWEDWGNYKYHIDIDGNSSPWSNLFQRLLSGGVVMKVESSRGLRQWFYDELLPWENYVPVAPDMSDLMDKVRWLQRNDIKARSIAEQGRELALRLTFSREMERGSAVIAKAFQYFGKNTDSVMPSKPIVSDPVRRKLMVIGDSHQGGNYNFVWANGRNLTLNGSVTFLNVLARQVFDIDIDHDFLTQGSSGTKFIISQIPAIIERKPDYLVFCAGHNDINQGLSLKQLEDNYIYIISELEKNGITPIMCLYAPENSVLGSTFVTLAEARAMIIALNEWKRDYACQHNILLWDCYTPMADPETGGYADGMTNDNVHPGYKAAFHVAKQGLIDLAAILPPQRDYYRNNFKNLVAEPLFPAGGGRVIPPVSGEAPSGWTIRRYAGAAEGGLISSSIIPADDQYGSWNRIAISGDTTGGTIREELGISLPIFAGPTTYQTGDIVEAWIEIRVFANSPFRQIMFSIGDHDGANLLTQSTNGGHASGETAGPTEGWMGILYCPRLTIAPYSGSGAQMLLLQIIPSWDASDNNFTGTFEFRHPLIRVVA